MMKKRIFSALLAVLLIGSAGLTALNTSLEVNAANIIYMPTTYKLQSHSKEEIKQKFLELPFDIDQSVSYAKSYTLSTPFSAGDLSLRDRNNALNLINFCRYVAGLPSDIQLNDEFNEPAQAGAYINAVNNKTTYNPKQPDNFPNMLYQSGVKGLQKSTLASGNYSNIADAVLCSWNNDSYAEHIQDRFGYKFWALNTEMKYTGLGQAENQFVFYTNDRYSRTDKFVGDYVMWPAENMPYELFKNHTFAVNLNDEFDAPYLNSISVDIKSRKTGQSWHLAKNSLPEGCMLEVYEASYDKSRSVLFSVDSEFSNDDVVDVTIKGLSKNGESKTIEHTTEFFSLSEVTLNTESITLGINEQYQLSSSVVAPNSSNSVAVYTSENPNIVSVSESGLITAVGEGTAQIKAELPNGQKAVCTVNVKKQPTYIKLSKTVMGAVTGEETDLKSMITTSSDSASFNNSYVSSNESVCSVDENGIVKMLKAGTASVTVTTYNGRSAKIQFIVRDVMPLTNTSVMESDSVLLKESINVLASSTGGEGILQYEVSYRRANTEKWTVVQNYSTNKKIEITPQALTDYEVCVRVKDSRGNISEKLLNFRVEGTFENKSKISSKKIKTGESIIVNADASGGIGSYKYAVLYRRANTEKWTVVQNYSTNKKIEITPQAITDYEVCVKAMDSDGTIAKNYFKFSVEWQFESQSVLSSEEIQFGESVTVSHSVKGGTAPYRYAVLYRRANTSKWTTVQNYTQDTETVITPQAVTDYEICVKAMDSEGNITKKYFNLAVKWQLTNKTVLSSESIKSGDSITVSHFVIGGTAPYRYAVLYRRANTSKWTTVQNYTQDTETVITPQAVTDYEICVKVKDRTDTISKKYFNVTVTK